MAKLGESKNGQKPKKVGRWTKICEIWAFSMTEFVQFSAKKVGSAQKNGQNAHFYFSQKPSIYAGLRHFLPKNPFLFIYYYNKKY